MEAQPVQANEHSVTDFPLRVNPASARRTNQQALFLFRRAEARRPTARREMQERCARGPPPSRRLTRRRPAAARERDALGSAGEDAGGPSNSQSGAKRKATKPVHDRTVRRRVAVNPTAGRYTWFSVLPELPPMPVPPPLAQIRPSTKAEPTMP